MILLYKLKEKQSYDITDCCKDKKWSGDKQKAPRSLTFNFVKTSTVEISNGDTIYFYNSLGQEIYRGLVFKVGENEKSMHSITTYDMLFYLANNKDSFSYKGTTLSGIFIDICNRYQLPMGEVIDTREFFLPEMNESNILIYDLLKKAMALHYSSTGHRFYVRSQKGKIDLIKRINKTHNWVIESGNNLINYNYESSIEELKSQIKLVSTNDKVTLVAVSRNSNLVSNYGILSDVIQPSGKYNQAQLQQLADSTLKTLGEKNTFSLNCLGVDDVITGDTVYISIPELGIKKLYYVDSDSHNYDEGGNSTMSLKLVESLD